MSAPSAGLSFVSTLTTVGAASMWPGTDVDCCAGLLGWHAALGLALYDVREQHRCLFAALELVCCMARFSVHRVQCAALPASFSVQCAALPASFSVQCAALPASFSVQDSVVCCADQAAVFVWGANCQTMGLDGSWTPARVSATSATVACMLRGCMRLFALGRCSWCSFKRLSLGGGVTV
jgi:hypothetical protein